MEKGFFHLNLQRVNRNFLITNLLFTLVLAIIIHLYFFDFFYNMILGPFPVDSVFLRAIPESSYTYNKNLWENCYIIRNKFFFSTGNEKILNYGAARKGKIRNWGEYVAAYYRLVKYGDKYLAVDSTSRKVKNSYKGVLIHLPPNAVWEIESSSKGKVTEADLFPVMLSTTRKNPHVINFKIVIFTLLFIINLLNYFRVFNRMKSIKNHPLYKRLGRYGVEQEVIASIDEEVDRAGGRVPQDGLTTSNWIIRKSMFKVEVERNFVNCKID